MAKVKLKSDHHLTNKTLGAVVIGTGGQGLRRAQAVRMATGWRLAGIFDSDINHCQPAAGKCNCNSFETIEEALSCNQAQVAIIATPPATHDTLIFKALERGLHVLCEKPLTIHPAMAEPYLNLAESRNLQIATGFNHRFFSPVIDLQNHVKAQTIGKVLEIRGQIGEQPPEAILDGWHGNPLISGGGVLTDNGSHLLDLARLFMKGETGVDLISLEMMPGRPGIEDHCEMQLTDDDELKAHLITTWRSHGDPYLKMEVHGESGVICISAFPWKLTLERPGQKPEIMHYLFDRLAMKVMGRWAEGLETSLIRELQSFRHCILNPDENTKAHATGRNGHEIANLIDEARKQSAQAHQTSTVQYNNRQIA
ncbi:MAG: Gfo/Idh/MocA family protein [bacterium]